ncbi:MAG: putative aconitase subunit 1 [Ilumatobacteraceae bacterium]|nr:putative aconitase subunit 1 [Ilumatobacteraceae bacterium]
MLDGGSGDAVAMAMRIVVGVARSSGAARLLEIDSAHVDGCLFHGDAGLEFAEALERAGGRVVVRTTLNVGSLDLLHPDMVRADPELAAKGRRLMEAYVALGCEQTWSCAPYQLSHRPAFGTHVAWAESNAITFVNSVLGARSDRYGDFLDIAAALTGRVPEAGLHRDEDRRAVLVLDCSPVSRTLLDEDAAWPVIGAILGQHAGMRVAALTGLPGDLRDGVTEDRLKALGATAAAAGGVALFHVVGVTPEAPTLDAVVAPAAELPVVHVTTADLRAGRDRLSTSRTDELDAVSLGTPHFSVAEFAGLAAALGDGPPFAESVDFYVSTSRAVLANATARGYVEPFERAGGRILTDTCTYITPVMRESTNTVMTNSGKLAWYAPSNLGVNTVLASLGECIASARAGRVIRDEAVWS